MSDAAEGRPAPGGDAAPLSGAAFIPFPGMEERLERELAVRFSFGEQDLRRFGGMLYVPRFDSSFLPYWSRCALLEPRLARFNSVSDAKNILRALQRSWAPYAFTCYRRTALIQATLPYINTKEREFPFDFPPSPIGAYCLLDGHTMLYSARTSSPLPLGTLKLKEDHEAPPSRAYLKLEEALLTARHMFGVPLPDSASRCFDAGASPGGWTYVLLTLGARVFAVDRAPLAPRLMQDGHIEFIQHDAFTLKTSDIGRFDWAFSDVACYPERLLDWIQRVLAEGMTRRMICTIKLHGECDYSLISRFEEIPHSRVVHLNYNKHELTFIHCE